MYAPAPGQPSSTIQQRSRPALHIPDTSLIICSRNRRDFLHATIDSISDGHRLPSEIIVIDQSDAPDPALERRASEQPDGLRYVWTALRGLSRGNNLGVSLAQYEWLIFTHDDVLVERDWFETLVGALQTAGKGTVVTGRVLTTAPEVPGGFATTLRTDTTPVVYSGRVGTDVIKPFNMAMHRTALDRAGGFDEELGPGTRFPGAEDSDLGFRLLESGLQVAYVPEALVYHRAWRPANGYLPLRWGYGVAQGAFFAKHTSRRDRYMLRRFLKDARRRAFLFPRRLLGDPVRALEEPLFIIGNVVGAVRWVVMHRRR